MDLHELSTEEMQAELDRRNGQKFWPAGSNLISTLGNYTVVFNIHYTVLFERRTWRELTDAEMNLLRQIPEMAGGMRK